MDAKIPPPSPPPSSAAHGGATDCAKKFLSGLPSRGLFSSSPTIPSSNLGCMRVYICDHDTSPPDHQLIKTDQMNILIRSLLLKKQNHKNEVAKLKGVAEAGGASRKRAADKSGSGPEAIGRAASGKRAATGEGERDSLQGLTVERLRIMLREKGLNVKGKKDELVARLRTASEG